MKEALILENDYVVGPLVKSFLEEFDIFDKKTELTGLIHRDHNFDLVAKYINVHSCLVFYSIFVYRDQLESFTRSIARYKYPLEIYMGRALSNIEDWVDSPSHEWEDRGEFFKNLRTCFNKHKIYSFDRDYHNKLKVNNLTEYSMKYGKVHFNSNTVQVKHWTKAT